MKSAARSGNKLFPLLVISRAGTQHSYLAPKPQSRTAKLCCQKHDDWKKSLNQSSEESLPCGSLYVTSMCSFVHVFPLAAQSPERGYEA